MTRLAGVGAVLGGLAWAAKGLAILITGDQPPLLFEVGPGLFGLCLLGLALAARPGRRRTASVVLGALAVTGGTVAGVTELAGQVWEPALVSMPCVILGFLMLGRNGSRQRRLAWWIALAAVPVVIVGGALEEINERLLELPLVAYAGAWIWLGILLVRADRLVRGRVGPSS